MLGNGEYAARNTDAAASKARKNNLYLVRLDGIRENLHQINN
jgi:hypothetical protein